MWWGFSPGAWCACRAHWASVGSAPASRPGAVRSPPCTQPSVRPMEPHAGYHWPMDSVQGGGGCPCLWTVAASVATPGLKCDPQRCVGSWSTSSEQVGFCAPHSGSCWCPRPAVSLPSDFTSSGPQVTSQAPAEGLSCPPCYCGVTAVSTRSPCGEQLSSLDADRSLPGPGESPCGPVVVACCLRGPWPSTGLPELPLRAGLPSQAFGGRVLASGSTLHTPALSPAHPLCSFWGISSALSPAPRMTWPFLLSFSNF